MTRRQRKNVVEHDKEIIVILAWKHRRRPPGVRLRISMRNKIRRRHCWHCCRVSAGVNNANDRAGPWWRKIHCAGNYSSRRVTRENGLAATVSYKRNRLRYSTVITCTMCTKNREFQFGREISCFFFLSFRPKNHKSPVVHNASFLQTLNNH